MEILEVKNIHKTYGDYVALDDLSLKIPEGSIYGLLGPNGAGKTTLIRIITQIIAPDSGSVTFLNVPVTTAHVREMGYLPEERGLYKKMRVGEQLLYLARLKGLTRADAIERSRMWIKKFDIASWWNLKVEDLSKGMQQKIQFIATVMHNPKLIILDEPFTGFDPVNANIIKDEILEIARNGSTIIFSTHRMESVEELCDYIALINKSKKVLEGPKKQIKENYRANMFMVEHKQKITSLENGFFIVSEENPENDYYRTTIKINSDDSPNQLLKSLMKNVEIQGFSEIIPSMNDIFIEKVNEKEA